MTPVWLRLTRKGDDITGEYSTDGKTWQGAADSVATITGLAKNVYAGLAITSHQRGQISQGVFQNLKITPM
jgi:regulation of enolase protein 1 (concanavalin A-like superfamily)